MRCTWKRGVWVLVLVLAPCVWTDSTTDASPGTEQSTTHEIVPIHPGDRLVFQAGVGSIEVLPTGGEQFVIDTVVKGRGSEAAGNRKLKVTRAQSLVKVPADFDRELSGSPQTHAGIEYHLQIPQSSSISLSTQDGNITVSGLAAGVEAVTSRGDLLVSGGSGRTEGDTRRGSIILSHLSGDANLRTKSGSIKLEAVSGKVKAETGRGNIVVAGLRGDLRAWTGSGDLDLSGVRGPVIASTRAGSIRAATEDQLGGPWRLETPGGDIDIALRSPATITAMAPSGSVSTDLDVATDGPTGGGTLQGTILGGGPTLRLRALNGSIHIVRSKRSL